MTNPNQLETCPTCGIVSDQLVNHTYYRGGTGYVTVRECKDVEECSERAAKRYEDWRPYRVKARRLLASIGRQRREQEKQAS
jgi:hypothetical protein